MTPVGPHRAPPRRRRPADPRPAPRSRGGAAPERRSPEPRPRRRPAPARPSPVGRRAGRPRLRLAATLVVLLLGFGAIVVRLVDVQVVGGQEYAAFGVSQRFQEIDLPADRGSIFDRNGNDL